MAIVEGIAAWAASLSRADVPDNVVALCRAQRRSVFGALAASSGNGAARRVLDAVSAWGGDPLYAATAPSIALDFDDYVSFGHTGHTSVLVPLLLGTETG